MSVENKILPIVHLKLKLTKHTPFFTLFAKNTAAMFLASGKNGSTPYISVHLSLINLKFWKLQITYSLLINDNFILFYNYKYDLELDHKQTKISNYFIPNISNTKLFEEALWKNVVRTVL